MTKLAVSWLQLVSVSVLRRGEHGLTFRPQAASSQLAAFQRFSRPLKIGASLGTLIVVLAACGFGGAASANQTTSGNQTGATSSIASTATTASTATATHAPAPTATHAPVPTATHAIAPTPTPVPPLQSQIIVHAFNNIGPSTNSPIVDMTCPSGYLVAGGGPNSGYTNFTMMQNAPLTTTTWRAEVNNDSASAINVQVQVVCLKVSGLQSHIVLSALNNVTAGSNSAIASITCPSGYLVAGGGPNSGYANFTMMQESPLNTTTWRAEAYNDNGSGSINVQEQVVCLKH